jgi:PAS domain S-box-containing protein
MRSSPREFGLIAGFALLAMLLAVDALIMWQRLHTQIELGRWVIHTHQVRAELAQAESLLVDAETGQRGYLLTGDAKFLAPYQRATAELSGHIDSLAELTADNPVQRAHIARLRLLVGEKMDELAQTVSLYRAGNAAAAKAIVLSDQGLLTMDQARRIFSEMLAEEARLDAERTAAYRQSVKLTVASIWLSLSVAVLGLAILGWFVLHSRAVRERLASEIRDREEWFRVTLTSIGDAVIATDPKGKVLFLNPEAEKLTGRNLAEVQGKDLGAAFPIFSEKTGNAVDDPVRKVMEFGLVVGLANHTVLRHSSGKLIPIEDSAAPIRNDRGELTGVVLVFRDVTAERKQQDILRRTEKLSAAARLSATMAHEINNPLAAVVNLIFIARNTPTIPPTALAHLAKAEQELERVTHITRQTLGFYRESTALERVDLPALVESVLGFYSPKFAAKGIIVNRAFEECPSVIGVAGELRQAVSNLIANAIDAVAPGGTVTVGARRAATDGSDSVELVIADDGPGIASEHIGRLFEPFFTTKKDVGTGLGLWGAKNIIERHGGAILVSPGNNGDERTGAAFTVRLPRATEAGNGA